MEPKDENQNTPQGERPESPNAAKPQQRITHNLDTGEDEVLPDLNDESIMDFASGSGGGSATDGGGA